MEFDRSQKGHPIKHFFSNGESLLKKLWLLVSAFAVANAVAFAAILAYAAANENVTAYAKIAARFISLELNIF